MAIGIDLRWKSDLWPGAWRNDERGGAEDRAKQNTGHELEV